MACFIMDFQFWASKRQRPMNPIFIDSGALGTSVCNPGRITLNCKVDNLQSGGFYFSETDKALSSWKEPEDIFWVWTPW